MGNKKLADCENDLIQLAMNHIDNALQIEKKVMRELEQMKNEALMPLPVPKQEPVDTKKRIDPIEILFPWERKDNKRQIVAKSNESKTAAELLKLIEESREKVAKFRAGFEHSDVVSNYKQVA